jgi:predicted nucleotidyltransferase
MIKFGLKPHIIEAIVQVFSNYHQIEKVILYGSRAMGNYKNGSDIDLTFLGNDLNLNIIHKIENDLDDLLLPYSFDLSIFNQISNENLKEHIQHHGIVFFEQASTDSGSEQDIF